MSFTIQHTAIGAAPFWYHLESHPSVLSAISRARNFVLDHGGYACVSDASGKTIYGTSPLDLDRRISAGNLPWFKRETARRRGCCA
jgi:hypothetical protein